MSFKWNDISAERTFGFQLKRISMKENRFYAIYFIDYVTGSLLVSKQCSDWSNLSIKEDLISSFLNAISRFIQEIKDDEIQEINLKDSRILYERKDRLLCVGISKKTNLQIERGILHEIVEDFYRKYRNQIVCFDGRIRPFVEYKEKLENLNLNSLFKFKIK
jgi:hypothetical protein